MRSILKNWPWKSIAVGLVLFVTVAIYAAANRYWYQLSGDYGQRMRVDRWTGNIERYTGDGTWRTEAKMAEDYKRQQDSTRRADEIRDSLEQARWLAMSPEELFAVSDRYEVIAESLQNMSRKGGGRKTYIDVQRTKTAIAYADTSRDYAIEALRRKLRTRVERYGRMIDSLEALRSGQGLAGIDTLTLKIQAYRDSAAEEVSAVAEIEAHRDTLRALRSTR